MLTLEDKKRVENRSGTYKKIVISCEIRPWQRYTPPKQKKTKKGLLSIGGMLMPTAFAPLHIVSV